jgi:uncharacterized membrane protein YdjX (TVP38/TMEM64 family)
VSPTAPPPPRQGRRGLRLAALLALLLALAAAWQWTPLRAALNPERLSAWLAPHREAWYALPATLAAFVVLGQLMVSVLVLVFATGLVFGPWMGTAYALAGALSSATASFWLGRWIGGRTVERLGGERVRALSRSFARNGILAVFLVRKIPAPFALVNLVAGSSGLRFRDFLLGTLLGMGPMIVALGAFGPQVVDVFRDPSPRSIGLAFLLFLVPFTFAFLANALFRGR